MTSLPLDGVRVIDFTQVMLGPCCTQMLADYGADVIKIEKTRIGDLSRWSVGSDPDGLNNPVFTSLNRNKRSLALDLKDKDACSAVRELLRNADVVVNNFRPGVMERMGFGYEDLKKINPRIIYAVGTGFGVEGPYRHKGGQDTLAQAMTGVMQRKSDYTHPTAIYSTTIADYSAGMHLVQGILLALLHRQKTGEGQEVAVSLYSSLIAAQMQEGTMHMMRGKELNWSSFPLSGVFDTSDGALVMVGAFKANPLRDICTALEIEDLSAKAEHADFDAQAATRPQLHEVFRSRYLTNTTAYWLGRLEGVDILCAPVRSLPEALEDEQTIINNLILDAGETPAGPVRVIGSPIEMSKAPVSVRLKPPTLGQHNEEILRSIDELQGDAA
ncbi:CaiB/BaiF CoA transferase family protein [Agrobacterium sp. NPDC090273]|uniref:CaiB/BaiF CoA transferase family protein n=1 Tax=Agrobacterium sp. NPDC090273 TaxID=3363919 RepID=UPI00383AFCD5